MGRNLPSERRQALEWLEGVISQWNTNFAAIGLTSASVIDLAQDIANSRGAFTSVELARIDAKAKTQDFYSNIDATHVTAADMISTVKAFAPTTGDPSNVYLLAGLTPREPPQPVPAPEQPTSLAAVLDGLGNVTISWDGRGPTGTVYNVSRRLPAETEFAFIGQGDGRDKTFTDTAVPSGTASAQYSVQAVRGADSSAPSATLLVLFGSGDAVAEMGMAA